MAERKPFLKPSKVNKNLQDLLEKAKDVVITDAQLREQRVSFAFGNALGSSSITKESVKRASSTIRICR
ncbi:MAG: hypothetical protein JKY32_00120 [Rhizobiales bacterium]|nr:hypothetical protein [Hyphomicrobiales bacterium]MBL4854881.1 hypothetical protein [Robiginitomaculum sp.]